MQHSPSWEAKWERVEHGVPQGSVLVPLLFLIYVNDLSRTLSSVANPILFADDTSIIISNIDSHEFKNKIIWVLNETTNWFQSNLLTHWGQGHLNCLNARSGGLNNLNKLLYCVSLKIYNKFVNYFCELKFSGNTDQRP